MRESLTLTRIELAGASRCPSDLVFTPIDTFLPHVPTHFTTYLVGGRSAGVVFVSVEQRHLNVVYVKDPSFNGNKASGSLAGISSCPGRRVNIHHSTVFPSVKHSHKFG